MSFRKLGTAMLLATVLGLGACANVKPYSYQATADEIKPGPGLFTGNKGKWVITP